MKLFLKHKRPDTTCSANATHHAALSSFQSSGRITRVIFNLNCGKYYKKDDKEARRKKILRLTNQTKKEICDIKTIA